MKKEAHEQSNNHYNSILLITFSCPSILRAGVAFSVSSGQPWHSERDDGEYWWVEAQGRLACPRKEEITGRWLSVEEGKRVCNWTRECLTKGPGVRAAAWKSRDNMLLRKGFLEISLCVVQLNPCLPTASSLYPRHPLLRRYPCL